MKKTIRYFFAIACGMGMMLGAGAQDLKLWYTQPAVKWTEALPIGNGRIGAMVFGGITEDRIQFNEETLWTGEPRNYSRHGAHRYLDSIRQLLFAGEQKKAEALAEKEFMGLKSNEGIRTQWVGKVLLPKSSWNNASSEIFDDSRWKTMTVPAYDGWETVGHDGLDGAVWLRTTFDVTPEMLQKELVLDLNRIRDQDFTYVNGKLVGSQETTEPRKYKLKREVLHPGKNTIAVLVLNYSDKGGITGFKDTSRHIGLYADGAASPTLSLNGQWKYAVQDDNPPAVGVYQASYQPFGDLLLHFPGAADAQSYKRELDIQNAIAATSYSSNNVNFKREYFVSQPDQALVVRLTTSKKSSLHFGIELSSPHKNFSVRRLDANSIALSVKVKNGALHGESHLRVMLEDGNATFENGQVNINAASAVTILLTAATNYKSYNDITANPGGICTGAMRKVAGKSFAQIKAAHVREYQVYFNAFSISLDTTSVSSLPTDVRLSKFASGTDPSFVALYLQYGRYLLISSSRPGTRPANLQGIWNDLLAPPWGSKYTTNINAEMNYWPAELLNLSPTHGPLFDMIKELAETGRQTAKDHYNAPGWVLHHNTDLWRGTAPINAANHGIWVTGGAWLCQHLWERYLFTQDKNFLAKAYPLMKSAAEFFKAFMIKDPATGYWISTPSNSPEQGGLVAGPTMDHQIIRTLFKNVVEAGEILKTDETFRLSLQEKMKNIAPNTIGKFGQLQEWVKDVDDTANKHRHISHLWGMYPGSEINWDQTAELMKAARQSLIYRGDAATGWSLGWKINCWARLKDAEHTYTMIKMLLSPVKGGAGSYANLFDAHPPFQIDGNFGGAAGIGEMLIQSHAKFIDILPALPADLANGEVKGICARGGFVMDIKWRAGKLQRLSVLSKAGMPLMVRYEGRVVDIPTIKNGVFKFNGALEKL